MAPMFDLEKMMCFADDINVIRWNKSLALLIVDMEKSLEAITSLGSQARRLMMKRLNYACSERSFWGTF